jgi:hypothetical protein
MLSVMEATLLQSQNDHFSQAIGRAIPRSKVELNRDVDVPRLVGLPRQVHADIVFKADLHFVANDFANIAKGTVGIYEQVAVSKVNGNHGTPTG